MGALDSLPPDQRAVLQLVLQRGRSYDEIAAMLSIDRAAVRQRALDGFNALGPESSVSAGQRALITDYLLDQLPRRVAAQVFERLGESPADRAWARVIAGEIASISVHPLPEIPVGSTRPRAAEEADRPRLRRERGRGRSAAGPEAAPAAPAAGEAAAVAQEPGPRGWSGVGEDGSPPRGSRRGGAVVLGGIAALVIVVAVVVVLLVTGGSKTNTGGTGTTGSAKVTSTTATTTGKTTSTTLAQANLYTSAGASDKTETGVAEFLKAGSQIGVVVLADGLPSDSTGKTGAYGIWLLNPGGSSEFLGFPDATVGTNGKLETEGALSTKEASNWSSFKDIAVTLETSKNPTTPGKIVLEGAINKAAAS